MPYCRKCGTEYQEGIDEFCNKCGIKLNKLADIQNEKLSIPKVSNTLVWWIAFLPLVGLIVENVISVTTSVPITSLWWITLIANIILCSVDRNKVIKVFPKFAISKYWVTIIPVYLFKRARALGHKLAYFIVWLVLFAIICFVPQSWLLNNPTLNFGLGSSQTISTVKTGYFNNYKEALVGDAIDKYLADEKWTSFNNDDYGQVVQVEGRTPTQDGKSYKILIQFVVNTDSTFNIQYLSVDGITQDVSYYIYFLDVVYGRTN